MTISEQCVHWFGCLTPHGQPPFWQHAQVYAEGLCGHWHPVNDAVLVSISIIQNYNITFCTNRVCFKTNTSGVGTANPYGASEFTLGFLEGSCCAILKFVCKVL